MSRELKFRAWDKRNKKMTVKRPHMHTFTVSSDTGQITNVSWSENEYSEDPDDFEVMQYTGLLDKSGKEIYEGDILKTSVGIREVFYHKCMFAIKINDVVVAPIFHEESEVIGNIHQNPELLNA